MSSNSGVRPFGYAEGIALHQLARLYGVQTVYYDITGQLRRASPESMVAVLRALGAAMETLSDAPAALRERHQALWQRVIEPVTVAWGGGPTTIRLRLPQSVAERTLACNLDLEIGETQSWTVDLTQLPASRQQDVAGARYTVKHLSLPGPLPLGYHRLTLTVNSEQHESLIISAPTTAYTRAPADRIWGVFLPLYALQSERSWGSGDFSDLESLMEWIAGLGGGIVSTLPLQTAFLDDQPFEPSPYSPASRLFWNEFYLDITRVPEFELCQDAQAIASSRAAIDEINALRSQPLVDYQRQMALKRQVLTEMARCFFNASSERQAVFRRFVETHPYADDYARFRATVERQRAGWPVWPQPQRDGVLSAGDYDEDARRYHLYAQWLTHDQVETLAAKAHTRGVELYLDLPLGVHPDSYDVWRLRSSFAWGISGGAPPDTFFTKGQDWGFPPLNPEKMRQDGYRYFRDCLQHHLSVAGILRLDHVMGLHRLFWVPNGMEAREGVYVYYPAEELYAILCLESYKHQSLIVGEDLGTVPSYVRPAMARHGIYGMYVMQYELRMDPNYAVRTAPASSVASLNTHDMPTFTAFWRGLDIDDRIAMGLLDDAGAHDEWQRRDELKRALASYLQQEGALPEFSLDEAAVIRAALRFLSSGPAQVVLVNVEDLWNETQPQNTPGTWRERPNWRRKARYSLESMREMPEVVNTLQEIDRLRRRQG